MGKKIIDFAMRRDASRGRKSKAGGGKKSKAVQLYTPLALLTDTLSYGCLFKYVSEYLFTCRI